MKQYGIFLALTVLVVVSLACNASIGGGNKTPTATLPAISTPPATETEIPPHPSATPATVPPPPSNDGSSESTTLKSDFPMTPDAYNAMDVGDGSLLYHTKMSMDDVLKFYYYEYTATGYKEREIMCCLSGRVCRIVFDGDPSGKAVVIKSMDQHDRSLTVAIRLEDV